MLFSRGKVQEWSFLGAPITTIIFSLNIKIDGYIKSVRAAAKPAVGWRERVLKPSYQLWLP
jgi:hypothetical protein